MSESLPYLAGDGQGLVQVKVSLLISLGGLGVHRVSHFALTTFISSLGQPKELDSDILGYTPPTSVHLEDLAWCWLLANTIGLPLREWMFY